MVPGDIDMEEESEVDKQEWEEGTTESSYENEQSMDENDKKSELRPRSPNRRSQDTLPERPFKFPKLFRRSQKSTKNIKPFWFREV